ncbi:MAG: hypothetical protein J6T44_00740 [Prevotella sp.]|nr:hypothetical protein [Prevotella sp.]
MLKIKAFPRIHITLIGMNREGYRINGGIGFSIASPTLNMRFEPDGEIYVLDKRSQGFSKNELFRLNNHLNKLMKDEHLAEGFRCVIEESQIYSHYGFGTSTMVYLSCIEALLIKNKREYTNNDVVKLSGRGGTSGIGISTYFKGGFVFDTGVTNNTDRDLAPSSCFKGDDYRKPLIFKNISLPGWEMGICIPPIQNKTENEEKAFFDKSCPIGKVAVENILYESVYGISSSLLENDFNTFCKSVDSIQGTKWKSLERDLYGDELKVVESLIRKAGAKCVGLSSLGPLLYFFGEDIDGVVDRVNTDLIGGKCYKTSFNNSGRILEYD